MRKLLSILILTFGVTKIVSAQTNFAEFQKKARAVKDTTKTVIFLIKLNSGKELFARHVVIRQPEIDSLKILNVPESNAVFASHPFEKAKGVIEIKPKSNVHLLNYRQILDKYKIAAPYRLFKVRIGIVPSLGGGIYASEDAIESVTVDTANREIVIDPKPDWPVNK